MERDDWGVLAVIGVLLLFLMAFVNVCVGQHYEIYTLTLHKQVSSWWYLMCAPFWLCIPVYVFFYKLNIKLKFGE